MTDQPNPSPENIPPIIPSGSEVTAPPVFPLDFKYNSGNPSTSANIGPDFDEDLTSGPAEPSHRGPWIWALLGLLLLFNIMNGFRTTSINEKSPQSSVSELSARFGRIVQNQAVTVQRSLLKGLIKNDSEAIREGGARLVLARDLVTRTVPSPALNSSLKSGNLKDRAAFALFLTKNLNKKAASSDINVLANPVNEAQKQASTGKIEKKVDENLNMVLGLKAVDDYLIAKAKVRAGIDKTALRTYSPDLFVATPLLLAEGVYFGVMFLGFILLVAYGVAKISSHSEPFQHPLRVEENNRRPMFTEKIGLRASQLILAFIFTSTIASLAIPLLRNIPANNDTKMLFVTAGAEVSIVAISIALCFLPIFGEFIRLVNFGLTLEKFKKSWYWGFLALPVALFLTATSALLINLLDGGKAQVGHPIIRDLAGGNGSFLTIFVVFITASILAPIYEELLFRGTLLPVLQQGYRHIFKGMEGDHRRLWAIFASIATSSLIFGAAHPTGITSWIPLGMVGAVNSILVYQTKSLWPSIITHGLFNAINLVMALLSLKYGLI